MKMKLKLVIRKGGAGSGHHGHAGRPGKVGGSLPGDGNSSASGTEERKPVQEKPSPADSTYNRDEWTAMSVPDRQAKWTSLSADERDKVANAKVSVKKRIGDVVGYAGDWPNTGNISKDIDARMDALKELVTDDGRDKISNLVHGYSSVLDLAGVSKELQHKMAMDALDILVVQENESLGRQLGDHGVHHLQGNINSTMEMLLQHPGNDSAETMASVYIAAIYHDAGYLTPPSHDFMDNGHPRWSMQYYDAHIRSMVADALGKNVAGEVSHIIRTHDATQIDWEEDLIASASRVADNTALFYEDKLPPAFRYVPGNQDILIGLATKEISIDDAKSSMIRNIEKTKYSAKVKHELKRSVREVSPVVGKMYAGMLGGKLLGFVWAGDHFIVKMKADKESTIWQKVLDIGQRQFAKFAKAYGIDPKQFMDDLNFQLKDPSGNILLEGVLEE